MPTKKFALLPELLESALGDAQAQSKTNRGTRLMKTALEHCAFSFETSSVL
jgi:hypothetical protein